MTSISRRQCLLSLSASLVLPSRAWSWETASSPDGRLIVLFLRGGFDGLFAVAPASDPRLPELRPNLSRELLKTGLSLSGTGFQAHPSCQWLADLFKQRELSFAPCAGTTDASRSHFQAQDLFELGSGATHGNSGWLARTQDALGTSPNARRAISFTNNLPLILQGGQQAPDVAPLSGSGLQIHQDKALDAIMAMHQKQNSGRAIEQAMSMQAEIDQTQGMDPKASRGAGGINGFPKMGEMLGKMLANNPKHSLAFIDLGGFDTHAGEEVVLNRTLPLLGEGLLSIKQGLGPREWQRTQILVFTEFGRTAKENGTQGTDHGHGSLALLLGGQINGGRMLGRFDGLGESALNEKRDLPVRADWRSLIARSLKETHNFSQAALQTILPGLPGLL